MKKRKFGAGKWNGFGGKVGDKEEFKNETVEGALMRESKEEFGIVPKDLQRVGEITFIFINNRTWDQIVHVFICRKWKGRPKESEEMLPKWFKISEIPYEQMWWDDRYWLPLVLEGKEIKAMFELDDEKVVSHDIKILA